MSQAQNLLEILVDRMIIEILQAVFWLLETFLTLNFKRGAPK
jgi:hypothetical protein